MSNALDDFIVECIGVLQEQRMGEDDPSCNCTFQVQIRILQTAQLDVLDDMIAISKKDLDALEWLQR